jgi:hypothetical protein
LGFIPISGEGHFVIEIRNLKLYGHTFLAFNAGKAAEDDDLQLEDEFLLKDLDIQVRYDDINFEFQNLMGGGIVGSTINMVINVIGEEIVHNQKGQIVDLVKKGFHQTLSRFL